MRSTNSFIHLNKRIIALFMAVMMLLMLCACGDEEEMILIPEQQAEELPMPEAIIEPGVELSVAMPEEVDTWHPFAASEDNTQNLLSLIMEPAIKLDVNGSFQPSIVESWEFKESGDKTIMLLNIRKDVAFHGDRGTVSADDIVFCLDLICSSSEDDCTYAKYSSVIASYQKNDDYTVRIELAKKSNDIFYLLSFPVLCKEYYKNMSYGSAKLPVGTGPYYVDSYKKGVEMELVRNDHWWRKAPVYSKIHAIPTKDGQPAMELYEDGSVSCVPTALATANSYAAEGKTSVYSCATQNYICLVPKASNRHLQSANVRMAISMAIDRSHIISMALLGEGQATETPLRPDLWFFEDSLTTINGYNTGKAASLLEEAGYKKTSDGKLYLENQDGSRGMFKLRLLYTEDKSFSYRESICTLIADQLGQIGIQVELVKKDAGDYKKALQAGDYDLALCSFNVDDNNDLTDMMRVCTSYGGYTSSALNDMIKRTRSSLTEEEMKTSFSDLEKEWLSSLPNIGLLFRERSVVMSADIQPNKKLAHRRVFADINEWTQTKKEE